MELDLVEVITEELGAAVVRLERVSLARLDVGVQQMLEAVLAKLFRVYEPLSVLFEVLADCRWDLRIVDSSSAGDERAQVFAGDVVDLPDFEVFARLTLLRRIAAPHHNIEKLLYFKFFYESQLEGF